MNGEELVSLIRGYISGLEEVALQNQAGTSGISLSDGFGLRPELSNVATGAKSGGALDQSVGAASRIGRSLPDVSKLMAGGSIVAPAVFNGLISANSLAGGDGALGNLKSVFSGGGAWLGLSAFSNLFGHAGDDEGGFDFRPLQYQWGLPAHQTEGYSANTSGPTMIDSRYDGVPRRVEVGESHSNRIDIRIEALDARSILERKEEIAEAVRQAMLTSGVLGTSLNEY